MRTVSLTIPGAHEFYDKKRVNNVIVILVGLLLAAIIIIAALSLSNEALRAPYVNVEATTSQQTMQMQEDIKRAIRSKITIPAPLQSPLTIPLSPAPKNPKDR